MLKALTTAEIDKTEKTIAANSFSAKTGHFVPFSHFVLSFFIIRKILWKKSPHRRGDCRDNAVAESFWNTLATKLIYRIDLINKRHAERALFEYIGLFISNINEVKEHASILLGLHWIGHLKRRRLQTAFFDAIKFYGSLR